MIDIPMNSSAKHKGGKGESEAQRRDRIVKRILMDFSKGMPTVSVGGKGGNRITEADAREIGRAFVSKGYFANMVYSVDGRFDRLIVSKSRMCGEGKGWMGSLLAQPDEQPAEADDDHDGDMRVEPDVFTFNGESVVAVSDTDKPYVVYRRCYPHKPKWIVADSKHRVVCLLLWRSHAQAVVDELNALADR